MSGRVDCCLPFPPVVSLLLYLDICVANTILRDVLMTIAGMTTNFPIDTNIVLPAAGATPADLIFLLSGYLPPTYVGGMPRRPYGTPFRGWSLRRLGHFLSRHLRPSRSWTGFLGSAVGYLRGLDNRLH